MRHKISHRKLNRTSEHRNALLKNMMNSLVKYEQIKTTLPKAKELRPKIEKIITSGKVNSLHIKKRLNSILQDKISVRKISEVLSKRYMSRKGGYTRIVKAGFRTGDKAALAIIEFVDRDVQASKLDIKPKNKQPPKKVEEIDTKKKEKKAKPKK